MLVASFDAFPSIQTKHINPMFYGSSKRIVIFWEKKILIFVVDEWFLFVLALVWWKKVQKYTVSSFKIINLNTQTRQLWAALHSEFRWNCHNHYFYRIFLRHCIERKYFEGVFNILWCKLAWYSERKKKNCECGNDKMWTSRQSNFLQLWLMWCAFIIAFNNSYFLSSCYNS